MAEMKIPIPAEVQNEIRQLFKGMALEVIREVKDQESSMKPYMTMSETAKAVGIAPSTLNRWVKIEGLKTIVVDGKKLVSKETLLKFLEDHES